MKFKNIQYIKPGLPYVLLAACCCAGSFLSAQVFVSPGTHMKIVAEATVSSAQDVTVSNTGMLSIDGNLVLKGNFTNQNPEINHGIGTLSFAGNQIQTLAGPNSIGSLIINNANGVNLDGNTTLTD